MQPRLSAANLKRTTTPNRWNCILNRWCNCGCTEAGACNYDIATSDDGSCLQYDDCGVCDGDNAHVAVAPTPPACNYDAQASVDDGYTGNTMIAVCVMVTTAHVAVADSSACNYDAQASVDVSCLQYDDCGVCDGDNSSCSGCTNRNNKLQFGGNDRRRVVFV